MRLAVTWKSLRSSAGNNSDRAESDTPSGQAQRKRPQRWLRSLSFDL
jgi:hypothetical protein